jgi:hypothetical protein
VRAEASRWLARLKVEPVSDAAMQAAIADLQRVRFGAEASWPDPAVLFRRARQVQRAARRRRTEMRPAGSEAQSR